MLGVLGALILGAGSYYFVFRDGETKQAAQASGTKERVKREMVVAPDAKKPKAERVITRESEEEEGPTAKKEREVAEDDEEEMIKRERENFDKKKVKSKKRPPAA